MINDTRFAAHSDQPTSVDMFHEILCLLQKPCHSRRTAKFDAKNTCVSRHLSYNGNGRYHCSNMNRKDILRTADILWAQGVKPSVRKVSALIGGSARDITPVLRVWWDDRTRLQPSKGDDLARMEKLLETERNHYMRQIDTERQTVIKLEAEIRRLNNMVAHYKKVLREEAPEVLPTPPCASP